MGPTRLFLWGIGVLLIIGGLVLIFFETGLAQWVPYSVAVAGLLLIVGLLFIGFSRSAPEPGEPRRGSGRNVTHVEEHHH